MEPTNHLAELYRAAHQLVSQWYGGRRVLAIMLKVEGEADPLVLPVASLTGAPGSLSEWETHVLEAIALGEAPTAEELARRVAEDCSPNFRSKLSQMRKRGLLGGAPGSVGYPRGPFSPA